MLDAVVAPVGLALDHLAAELGRLIVVTPSHRPETACPVRGWASSRGRARYGRRLAALRWHGLAVA